MIRDPKALAEACANALAKQGLGDEHFNNVPVFVCDIHAACSRFVNAAESLHVDEINGAGTHPRQIDVARSAVAQCSIAALGAMCLIGNQQWSLRLGLQRRPWPYVTADAAVRYIRDYASSASRAWHRGSRKDVLFALELVVVGCADIARNSPFNADLDDLVLEALAKQPESTP